MNAATEPGRRIATLDIVRGVAMMGIQPLRRRSADGAAPQAPASSSSAGA